MKNFKLLLATTAILSTGALLANAEDITADFTAKASVVIANEIKKINDVDFDKIVKFSPDGSGSVYIDSESGLITVDSEEIKYIGGMGSPGKLEVVTQEAYDFLVPQSITLYGQEDGSVELQYIPDLFCVGAGYGTYFTYECNIGGELQIESGTTQQDYLGNFEVTMVLDEENNSGNTGGE